MPRKESPIASRKSIFTKTSQDTLEEPVEKPRREKRTYHLPEDVVILLGELQLHEHRQTGTKPELSDLVAEAIRQLASERLNSKTA